MMTEESPLKEKMDRLKKYIAGYKRKSKDPVNLGFATDDSVNLSYGHISVPITSLSRLLAKPGENDGGFPKGKYSMIAGPEKSSKTTLMLQTIGHDHETDPNSIWAWIDAENSLDLAYAIRLGVDPDRLFVIKDGVMEDVMQRIIELAKENIIKGVVVDSVGALTPLGEVQNSKGEKHELAHTGMLDLQRKLGQFFRMSSPWISKSNAACIMITHVYQDPGANGMYVAKGGNAMKHWGHIRLMMRRAQDKSTEEEVTLPDGSIKKVMMGHDVIIKLDKTRQNGNELQEVVIPYRIGVGLDARASAITTAINLGIIEKSGSWFSMNDEKIGQGKKKVLQYFEDKKLYEKLLLSIVGHTQAQPKSKTTESNLEDNVKL
jgi:recombination protein RecA